MEYNEEPDEIAWGDDYEEIQTYVEDYGRNMTESRFSEKYKYRSMLERLEREKVSDIFEIEERLEWVCEEDEGNYDYD